MHRNSFVLALLGCFAGWWALQAAGVPGVTLDHTERHQIKSASTGQTYELLVSLPAEYKGAEKRYPVVYILDGWTVDDDTASTVAFVDLLDELHSAGLSYRQTVFPAENHNSVRTLSFPSALHWV
jgi:predicted alpha/beta superfamily hydrolase